MADSVDLLRNLNIWPTIALADRMIVRYPQLVNRVAQLTSKTPQGFTNYILVIDLDETVINSAVDFNDPVYLACQDPSDRYFLADRFYQVSGVWGLFRPHMKEFMNFAHDYFAEIVIFSAGTAFYVHEIVDKLFLGRPRPRFIFTRDDLIFTADSYYKPLELVYDQVPGASPINTILLDDLINNIRPNFGNAIQIPPYRPLSIKGGSAIDRIFRATRDDPELLQLWMWFLRQDVLYSRDIRTNLMVEDVNPFDGIFDLSMLANSAGTPAAIEIELAILDTPVLITIEDLQFYLETTYPLELAWTVLDACCPQIETDFYRLMHYPDIITDFELEFLPAYYQRLSQVFARFREKIFLKSITRMVFYLLFHQHDRRFVEITAPLVSEILQVNDQILWLVNYDLEQIPSSFNGPISVKWETTMNNLKLI